MNMARLMFSAFVDRAFWAILIGISGFGVKFLQELASSVQDLNGRVGIVIERLSYHDEKITSLTGAIKEYQVITDTVKSHEFRIQHLEKHVLEETHHYEKTKPTRSSRGG